MELLDLRKQLEDVDKKMASLFEKRMEIIENVRKYKNAHKMDVYDSVRENDMHNKYKDYIINKDLMSYYFMFLESTLLISKNYMYDKNQDV